MKPKPDLKKIAKADDKIATAADEMIKGPLWMIEQILRKHEQAVMEVMAEQQQEIRRLEDERDDLQARIEELEAAIKNHGIPVKTYAGGEAHYCTRETLLDAHAKQVENEEVSCNPDPRAPHGFCRGASHSAGRYVCECENWEPEK